MRDFLQFWHFELKLKIYDFLRVFLYKAIIEKAQRIWFLEASVTFHASHTVRPLPLFLTPCYVCAALPLWFMTTQHLRHVTKCCACHEIAKCSSTRENDTLASTRFQSIAPATQNANAMATSQKATKTRYICEEMDLEHVMSTFSARRPTVRLSTLTANTLPTVAVVETTGEHDSNLQTSSVKREPFHLKKRTGQTWT